MTKNDVLLSVRDLHAAYGSVKVLHGLNFDVGRGEVVVLLGANGAGKTTTLRAICGMVDATGSVRLDGDELLGRGTEAVIRRGVAHVPQGRGIFGVLSVEDNLRAGAWARRDPKGVEADLDRWYTTFPQLAEHRRRRAGGMSGGEQQMLAVARALMARPKLLLLDEPSLGLAKIITRDLFRRLTALNRDESMSMLVIEQNAELALRFAHRGHVIESGHLVLGGDAADIRADDGMRRAYLGY